MKNMFVRTILLAALTIALLPFNVQANCDFVLYEPFVFEFKGMRVGDADVFGVDNVLQGCMSKKKLRGLQDVLVVNTKGDDSKFFFLSGDDGKRIKTKTCKEYTSAIEKGLTAKTDEDKYYNIVFHKTCGVLDALSKSTPYKHDFINARKGLSVKSLPVIFLNAPFGLPYDKLIADGEKETSFEDYLVSMKNTTDKFELVERKRNAPPELVLDAWYGDSDEEGHGIWLELHAIAKGDFNKDGYADLLVYYYKAANRGFWFEPGFALLTSKDPSRKLYEVYDRDFMCTYKDKKYVCANPTQGKDMPTWSTVK
jgi:hypothetical protein